MKIKRFNIENFKGIKSLKFNLDKSPDANIYTLVGLNESGKTTILEAINMFNFNSDGISALDIPGVVITDYHTLIPISQRDNFNGNTIVEGVLEPDSSDWERIKQFAQENTSFQSILEIPEISWTNRYVFENSNFIKDGGTWTGLTGVQKADYLEKVVRVSSISKEDNLKLASFVKSLFPSVLYYPNFLFDFPNKIYLESSIELTTKERFYVELVQDILYSLNNGTTISKHLVERIKSDESNERRNLDSLLQKMGRKVTEVIFEAWNRIFKRTLKNTKINVKSGKDANNLAFLEFEIEAPDGIYQINERSLGFKWFFIFLLFTQFRKYRDNSSKNIIFLFDEPASNLHSVAQQQLLRSFETLTENCKIIYTTHSHHLINPNWLESTYVVKNEGLSLENPEEFNVKQTDIRIQAYRDFANHHPHNTAYFQPILDVLNYSASELELVPSCVFLEGKNDYYTIRYMAKIILETGENLHLAPSTGSGNIDTLISLYMGWGRKFILLLDSDKEGATQKDRYTDKFGIELERKVFLLSDIDASWASSTMEDLFEERELLEFQRTCYPDSVIFKKALFNRAIQENLINKKEFAFSDATKEKFQKVVNFLKQNIDFVYLTEE